MTEDKVVDKIRKLLAQAESAEDIGNPEEAAAFSERASLLMEKYKVEMSDIEFEEYLKNEDIDGDFINWKELGHVNKRKACSWTTLLATSIGNLFSCRVAYMPGCNNLMLYGHTTNRAAAKEVIGYLVRLADKLAKEGQREINKLARDMGDPSVAKGYRKSFLSAFVMTVSNRVIEVLESRKQQYTGERGLMVLDEAAQVDDFLKDKLKKGKSIQDPRITNITGFRDGAAAAADVNIQGVTRGLN